MLPRLFRIRFSVLILVPLVMTADCRAEGEGSGFRNELRHAVDAAELNLKLAPAASAERSVAPTPTEPIVAPAAHAPMLALPPAPPAKLSPPAAQRRQLTSQPAVLVSTPVAESEGVLGDPLEPLNRALLAMNLGLMTYVLDPAVDLYRRFIPPGGRRAVGNVFRNLREPVYLLSAVMQGEWEDAKVIVSRFIINTILGIGGVVDQANVLGLSARVRTVDQALCRWGLGSGPYVVLPVLGPSSARDTGARVAVLTVQTWVLGVYVIPYRVADVLVQYSVTRDTWEALGIDGADGYERLLSIYQLYSEMPCSARNASENGLFFQ